MKQILSAEQRRALKKAIGRRRYLKRYKTIGTALYGRPLGCTR